MKIIDLIGVILKGRYCVIEKVGQGGDGNLYLARDLELGGIWAVKEIPLLRKKEAKLLRLLEYHALPKMIDYLEKGENCYLVMEYIRGKSLGKLLKEGKQFSFEEIFGIAKETAQILMYLHARKPPVYYGDLKPDNLMFSEDGKLYLIDFGSAVLWHGDRTQVTYGTKGYAAPEQYTGHIEAASDIYAFGKTILELCGRKKWLYFFRYPSFLVTMLKCCADQPEKRWKNAKELYNRLEKIRAVQSGTLRNRIIRICLLSFTVLLILVIGITRETISFCDAVSEVTDNCYQEEFLNGSSAKRKVVLTGMERKMQRLLKQYTNDEEQKKLLLLLALICELMEEEKRAELYYEQLSLYNPDDEDAYVEYGLFLYRRGKPEQSFENLEKYESQNKDQSFAGRNLKIWKKKMKEWKTGQNDEKKEEETE